MNKLDSYGLNYADPKLDNFAISIDGKLKFIDLESVQMGKQIHHDMDVKYIMSNSFCQGKYRYGVTHEFLK